MQWHSVADGPDERTEVFEIANRGCLVRIVVRGPDGRWTTTSVCWAPALRMADFSTAAPASAPVAAEAVPTASAPAPQPAPGATPAATPEPAAAAPAASPPTSAAPAEPLVPLLREYAAMRTAVVGAFRGKIGVSSGPIGFLDNLPQVGGFTVPGHGDWIWRVDPNVATLRSKNKVIELSVPDHARDDAFDPESLTAWLTAGGKSSVEYEGAAYPVDVGTVGQLVRRLEDAKLVRLFSTHPKVVYIVK